MVKLRKPGLIIACVSLLGLRAPGEPERSPPDCATVINETARLLDEQDLSAAHQIIQDHLNDLSRCKSDLFHMLKEPDPDIRRAALMALSRTLVTRDIPLILEYAGNGLLTEAEARKMLNSLVLRSPLAMGRRSLEDWETWWKKNRYRLDLDRESCLNRARKASSQYENESDLERIIAALKSTTSEQQWDLTWALSEISAFSSEKRNGSIRLSQPFIQRLSDPSANIRQSAAFVLFKLKDPATVEPLAACLRSDRDARVQRQCIQALEAIGRPSTKALTDALQQFTPEGDKLGAGKDVVARLLDALGSIGNPDVIPDILRAYDVNRAFSNNLAWSGDRAVHRMGLGGIDYLVTDIGAHEGTYVTTTRLPPANVATVSKSRELVLGQISRKTDDEPRKEQEAGLVPEGEVIIAHLKKLLNSPDGMKQTGAAICLARKGDQEAALWLIENMQTGAIPIRPDAIETIGFAKPREAIPLLLEILRTETGPSAVMATQALGKLQSEEAIDDLVQLAGREHQRRRGHLCISEVSTFALAQIGGERALETLLAAAQPGPEEDISMRLVAIYGLGLFSGNEALEAIVSGLDSDRQLREPAVKALGLRGGADSVDWLIRFLGSDDPSLYYAAVEELGKLGDKRAVPALIPLLTHEEWNCRLRAPTALAQLGDPAAIPALQAALKAPVNRNDYSVREYLNEAIQALEAAAAAHTEPVAENPRK